jgi:citrate lyase beta subunit
MDGLEPSCRLGRRQSFLGRTAIHPRRLPVIAAALQLEPEEVARALPAEGTVAPPDGRFADRAMVGAARREPSRSGHQHSHVRRCPESRQAKWSSWPPAIRHGLW